MNLVVRLSCFALPETRGILGDDVHPCVHRGNERHAWCCFFLRRSMNSSTQKARSSIRLAHTSTCFRCRREKQQKNFLNHGVLLSTKGMACPVAVACPSTQQLSSAAPTGIKEIDREQAAQEHARLYALYAPVGKRAPHTSRPRSAVTNDPRRKKSETILHRLLCTIIGTAVVRGMERCAENSRRFSIFRWRRRWNNKR